MTSTPFHLEPIYTDQYVMTGDVLVAEGVMIAPGVLLQADPGSRIILGSGVCLGMGCVVHANGGEIRIDAGVNLGAGVLVVGAVKIGPGAIVGAGTTVFEHGIEAGQLVPPNSLLANPTIAVVEPVMPSPAAADPDQPSQMQEDSPQPPPDSQPVKQKVNVDGHGFFFSKANQPSNVINDPWANEPPVVPAAPKPDSVNMGQPSSTVTAPDQANIPLGVDPPVVSTFVDPGNNCEPKHAWQTTADIILNEPTAAAPTGPSTDPPLSPIVQPNPDSDLSAAEMQNGGAGTIPTDPSDSAALVPPQLKQVYGQAYVNQMLGRMMGRHP